EARQVPGDPHQHVRQNTPHPYGPAAGDPAADSDPAGGKDEGAAAEGRRILRTAEPMSASVNHIMRRAGRSEPRATGVRELPGAYIRKMMPRIESGLVLDIRPGKQVLKTNFNVGTPAWLLTSSSGGSKSHHHLHLGCRIKARSIARASCYTS